jgi:hypothetical protein
MVTEGETRIMNQGRGKEIHLVVTTISMIRIMIMMKITSRRGSRKE